MPRKNSVVLVVLDDPAQAKSVCSLLAGNDYNVVSAAGFAEALRNLEKKRPDLVITNVEALLADSAAVAGFAPAGAERPPVIAIGGKTGGPTILEVLEAGADDYIERPGDDVQILARSAKLLERRQAQSLLDEKADLFRSMTDNVSDIISILSIDGTVVFETPSVERILGHKPVDMIGKNAFDFVHPDDRERVLNVFFSYLENMTGLVTPVEYRFRSSSNGWRVLESLGRIVTHPVHGVIAVVNSRDVTERRKSEAALRDSEEKFRLVLDNSLDIIYQFSLITGTFDYTSRATKSVTGYEQEDFVKGGADFAHSLIHPDDLEAVKKAFHWAVENAATGLREHSVEYRMETKHRGVRWIRENRALMIDGNRVVGIIATARDVTDQKEFEASLHLQKTLLESQTEGSRDGIVAFDADGKVISHNKRVVEMLRHPDKSLVGKHYKELRDFFREMLKRPDKQEEYNDKVRRLAIDPNQYDHDEFELKDGRVFESYTVPIADSSGAMFGRVSYITDVTERKEIENALRESEDRYRDIVENAEELICTHDLSGRILSVNKKFELVAPVDKTKASEIFIQDLLLAEFRHLFDDYLTKIRKTGAAKGRMAIRGRDGTKRVWEYNNTLRTEGVDEPIVRGMAVDVTERLRAEEQLRESEERFRNMADTAPVQIWISGLDKKLTYANKTMLDFTGKTLEDEIENGFKGVHPDDFNRARDAYHKAFDQRASYTVEYRHRRFDGEYRWIMLIGVPRWTASGTFLGYIGSSVDITERRETEESLRRTEEQLRQAQKLESVGRLAGGIAHDFNNMLTAIIGYSDISLAKLAPDDPLRRNLEEVRRAAERSASLTSQLLAFSRQQVLQPRIVEFNDLINETIKMLGRLIGENITLEVELDPELGTVEADPAQLTQVVVNLAVNARDAMPNGGKLSIKSEKIRYTPGLPLSPEIDKTGWLVLLTVSDTGGGIDAENLPHVFEPFFTTKEVGKGTGLGLATVYGIVKQSSGEIFVESEQGKGTTFKIYLPCLSVAEAKDSENKRMIGSTHGTETILIVEDEEMVRELARNILAEEGYEILTANNGLEALELTKRLDGKIDLVITDVVMPKMSGLEFAREIKKTYGKLPILFTSGYTDDNGFLDELRTSNVDFLGKPFVVESLVAKVREFLDQCKR